MKIIDLLVKISKGEEVPEYMRFFNRENNEEGEMVICEENIIYYMNRNCFFLNDEVEVIEEPKKLEKISTSTTEGVPMTLWTGSELEIIEKVNEIIDYLMEIKNDNN